MVNLKKTFFSASVVAFGVLLSRITGLFRDIAFAKWLGTGIIAEAFYVAFRLPNTFRRIFAEGAFSNVFVPVFSIKYKENEKEAKIFSGNICLLLFCILLLFTSIIEVFMPEVIRLINPGFVKDAEKFNLTVYLSRICFPYIMLISITSLFGAILNSVGRFWQFASISAVMNITFIVGIVFFRDLFLNSGFCLSWMLIIAGLLQILILIFFCRKYKIYPSFHVFSSLQSKEHKGLIASFFRKFLPAVVSSGILQINIFVDGIFASFFTGAVSYLYYTDRVGQFPLSMIGYSLSIALLPSLSVAFASKDNENILKLQKNSMTLVSFFAIPAMLLIAVLSTPLIQLIYERGEFTSNDTVVVGNMLSIYAISIPFNILSKILFTCFYAKKDTNTPLKISIFSLFLNIILNMCLFKIIEQYCVITATTISAILSTIVSIIVLKKRNILLISLKDLHLSYRIAILSIITCLIVPMFLFFYLQYNIFLTLFIAGTLHLFGCFLLRLIRPVLNCLLDR